MQETEMPQTEMERRRAMRGRLFGPRRMMSCPMCGWAGYGPHYHHRRGMPFLPLTFAIMSLVTVLLAFTAGLFVGSARRR